MSTPRWGRAASWGLQASKEVIAAKAIAQSQGAPPDAMPHQPSPVRPMLGGRRRQASLYAQGNPIVTPLGVDDRKSEEPPTADRHLSFAFGRVRSERNAVEQPHERQGPPLGFDGDAAALDILEGELGAIRGKGDLHRWVEVGARGLLLRVAEALQGWRQLARAQAQGPGRGRRQGRALRREAREGIKQQGRRRRTSGEAGGGRAVGTADPNRNGVAAVVADRPGVAK